MANRVQSPESLFHPALPVSAFQWVRARAKTKLKASTSTVGNVLRSLLLLFGELSSKALEVKVLKFRIMVLVLTVV